MELEQRLLAVKADVVATLGRRATKPSTLAASHEHHADLVVRNVLQARLVPFVQVGLVAVDGGGGCGIWQRLELGRLALVLCLWWVQGTVGDLVDVLWIDWLQLLV